MTAPQVACESLAEGVGQESSTMSVPELRPRPNYQAIYSTN
jgi:hypothetical protein